MRCFSSLGCFYIHYVFMYEYLRLTTSGFPHSDITGSLRAYRSPMHFVVCHVLLQLLVPRHSPCALINLTFGVQFWILSNLPNLCFVPFHLWKCSILLLTVFYLLVWFAYLLFTLVKSRCRCYLVFKNHTRYKNYSKLLLFILSWEIPIMIQPSTPYKTLLVSSKLLLISFFVSVIAAFAPVPSHLLLPQNWMKSSSCQFIYTPSHSSTMSLYVSCDSYCASL